MKINYLKPELDMDTDELMRYNIKINTKWMNKIAPASDRLRIYGFYDDQVEVFAR